MTEEEKTLDEHLENLNEMQKKAVYHSGVPLLIRAGAGSGKTRVITTKIAYLIEKLNVPPSSILALTFTNKAAKEMKERAMQLSNNAEDSVIKTFHSFGVWFLRQFARDVELNPYFTIYDVEASCSLLAHIKLLITEKEKTEYNFAKAIEVPKTEQTYEVELTNKEVSYFFEKISRAKDYCLTPQSPDLYKIDSTSVFRKIYTEYQNRLKETRNVDFGDLILLPGQILKENLHIRAKMQNKFSVILVDEYQDTNIAQVELLKLLAGEGQYLCVVGDEDQAIYKFRGAEIKNILNFQDMFKKTMSITLDKNYRSKENILKVANSIIAHNTERFKKNLQATRGEGQAVQVAILENQDMEAAYCASLVMEYKDKGYNVGDWAIIYRTNKQSNTFETTFLYQNIPYVVVGSLEFYQREEVKDAIALLSLIFTGSDEVALRRLLLKHIEGIGKTKCEDIINNAKLFMKDHTGFSFEDTLVNENDFITTIPLIIENLKKLNKTAKAKCKEFINQLISLRNLVFFNNIKIENDGINEAFRNSLAMFIDYALTSTGIYAYYREVDKKDKTEKCENLNELVNSAVHYERNANGLRDFLDYIALREELENKDSKRYEESVKLMSMHNTKGLEFKNVVVTGLEKGLFPRNEYDLSEVEEERRLMYVACTRAMDNLFITSCRYRRNVYSSGYASPSVFLSEIGSGLVEAYEIRFGSKVKIDLSNVSSIGGLKYKVGMCVAHKEYGYGRVDDVKEENGEYVINVHFFESGQSKIFLPEYAHNLSIVPGVTLKDSEDEY
ncbi:MAG: ATP-dependent helicase [Treponema sp.]